jgi:hypothetical protein
MSRATLSGSGTPPWSVNDSITRLASGSEIEAKRVDGLSRPEDDPEAVSQHPVACDLLLRLFEARPDGALDARRFPVGQADHRPRGLLGQGIDIHYVVVADYAAREHDHVHVLSLEETIHGEYRGGRVVSPDLRPAEAEPVYHEVGPHHHASEDRGAVALPEALRDAEDPDRPLVRVDPHRVS